MKKRKKNLQVPYTSTRSLSDLSHTTIENYANDAGLKFKHFIAKPKLSEYHKQIRKNFCAMNKNDNLDKWIFSDESSFQLFRNTKGAWTFDDQIFIEKINSYNTLMIWGAITKNGRSKLYFFELGEHENQEKYIEILETCLIPMQEALFPDGYFVYYQDNAGPHKGILTKRWTETNIPYIPEVPPYSCDLNPIENIWSILKSEVEKRQPKTMEELKKAIGEEWYKIDQDVIRKCIEHCRQRMKDLYEKNGEFI